MGPDHLLVPKGYNSPGYHVFSFLIPQILTNEISHLTEHSLSLALNFSGA